MLVSGRVTRRLFSALFFGFAIWPLNIAFIERLTTIIPLGPLGWCLKPCKRLSILPFWELRTSLKHISVNKGTCGTLAASPELISPVWSCLDVFPFSLLETQVSTGKHNRSTKTLQGFPARSFPTILLKLKARQQHNITMHRCYISLLVLLFFVKTDMSWNDFGCFPAPKSKEMQQKKQMDIAAQHLKICTADICHSNFIHHHGLPNWNKNVQRSGLITGIFTDTLPSWSSDHWNNYGGYLRHSSEIETTWCNLHFLGFNMLNIGP